MSTGRAEPHLRRARRVGGIGTALLLAVTVVGCSDDEPAPPSSAPTVSTQVQDQVTRTLRQRSRALAQQNRQLFRRTVSPQHDRFRASQRTYFDNLAQLPVAGIEIRPVLDTLATEGTDHWVEVEVSLQLAGYDEQPVTTRDRYRFSPAPRRDRLLLSSTTDTAWEAATEVRHHPWDLGAIRVREESGVLGVFDQETITTADTVLDAATQGRFDVADHVPEAGVVDVVVYATSDLRHLSGPGLSVSEPQQVDAVTVPVFAEPGGGAVAAYRIVVHPRVLEQELSLVDRLLRHELTHVAVGDRADGAPVWLNEGIAEWVSVQPIPADERRLPADTLALAEGVGELPADTVFAGRDARAWYGVAWWICEYIAATYDESYLWELLDATAGGLSDGEAVTQLLGRPAADVVAAAMESLRDRYAPAWSPASPSPPGSPGSSPTPVEPPDRS